MARREAVRRGEALVEDIVGLRHACFDSAFITRVGVR